MEQAHISFDLVGSILGEDIFSDQGILLLKKGTYLKEIHIHLLQKFRFGSKVTIDVSEIKTSSLEKETPSTQTYASFQSYIKDTFRIFLKDRHIDQSGLRERYHHLVDLSLIDLSILHVLQTAVNKEDYLYQHSINVGVISAMIGKILGYNKRECLLMAEMGLWHDIGMFNIDQTILVKEGPLLKEEILQIQKHTKMGFNLLKSVPDLDPIVSQSAFYHHERINGTGYPNQLKDGDIPYMIQIISVADCFNAMSMKVHYGEKKSHFTGVYELINQTYEHLLNPAIVIPFVRYIMRQHLHQKVMLSNGEEAEIIFIHENEPHQPLVKVQDRYIDLRKESSIKIVSLVEKIPQETTPV